MPALRLNDTYIDLGGASIKVYVFNPLFDPDSAEALFSIPLKLPATPPNLATFKHANRLDNADNTTTYPGAVLEIAGLPFETNGVLELDDQAFTPDFITVVFKNTAPALLEELDKININEVLETVTTATTPPIARWTFAVVSTPPLTVNITIGGELFVRAFTFGTFPADYAALATSINAEFPGLATATASNLYLDSALLEQHPVESFVNIDLLSKFTTGESVYQGFLSHVTEVNTTPVATHCWPVISWPGFYKETSRAGFWDFVNPWLDGTHQENTPRLEKAWEATYIPFVYSTYVLSRIADALPGILDSWAGWPVDDPDGASLILFNNRCLDRLEENYYDIDDRRWLNRMVAEVDLNKHVPDMTAAEYVQLLCEGFALWFRQVGTSVTFYKKRDMLADLPIDWTSLSEPGYTATRRRRRGFTFDFPKITKEDAALPHATQLQPFVSGEGWNDYTLPFHTTTMSEMALANLGARIKAPLVNQPGSGDEAGLGNNEPSTRFLFFRGLQPSSTTEEYPMASHDNTDYNDDPTGDLTLDLLALDGIYHQHHKGLLELLADGQPITLPIRLGIADILTARKWDNARRTITLKEGQTTAVIKSIAVEDGPQGLGVSLVEFVQEK